MKRIFLGFLCTVLLVSFAACAPAETPAGSSVDSQAGSTQSTAPSTEASQPEKLDFNSFGESTMAALMEAGFTAEIWNDLPAQEQQMLLQELGLGTPVGSVPETKPTETKPPKPTLADVEAGGSYVITIGDSLGWNYFELYYEDGVLVRIYVHFAKNDEEEPEIMDIQGDEIAEFGLFFIDYTAGPTSVVNALQDQGYNNLRIKRN